ncbi:MAG: DUF6152 family protein [Acidobacteriota bacterium]
MGSLRRWLLFAAMVTPLLAHHSTAPYDMTKEFTVSGVVTEFRWSNPHSSILLDAADAEGKTHHWLLEAEALNLLQRNGWTKQSLKKGDQISCMGARAKDPATFAMKCFVVTFPDGRKLVATPTSVPHK